MFSTGDSETLDWTLDQHLDPVAQTPVTANLKILCYSLHCLLKVENTLGLDKN